MAIRRNRYDIFFEILDVCKKKQCISYLMQKCKLSYAQATKYLTHLNDHGFLEKDGTSFKSTYEGLILIEEFERLFNKLNACEV